MDARVQQAVTFLNDEQHERALAIFDSLLSRNEQSEEQIEALYGKAFALGRLGRAAEAVATLASLLEVVPNHPAGRRLHSELNSTRAAEPVVTERLRMLVIHTYYQVYLDDFIKRHPDLVDYPYAEQMEMLLAEGFAANHMYSVEMGRFNYDTTLIVANCLPSQVRWCAENGGTEIIGHNWRQEILIRQIEHYRPDVIFVGDPIQFDSKVLRHLHHRPLTIGWRAAMIPPSTDWSSYDLILSHLSVCRDAAVRLGAKEVLCFHPGTAPIIAKSVEGVQKTHDVVFSGGWTPDHAHRNELISTLAERAERNDFSLALYLLSHHFELPAAVKKYNFGERWGAEMYRVLRQGKIVVNAEINLARGEAGNSRLFETTSAGSFLLTEAHPNIGDYFTPGVEIETYSSSEELFEKITYYLAHEEEREKIAARGRARCLTEYSMERRCKVLNDIIRTRVGRTQSSRKNQGQLTSSPQLDNKPMASESVVTILEQAVSHLQSENGSAAITLLDRAIDLGATMPEVFVTRAVAYSQIGKTEEAIRELSSLLEKIPYHPGASSLLSSLKQRQPSTKTNEVATLFERGAFIDAMRCAKQAIDSGEKSAQMYFLYGMSLEAVGRCEEACDAARRALTVDPTHGQARGLFEKLGAAIHKSDKAPLNPEQRSYHTTLPAEVLENIQNASHNYSYRGVPMIKNPFDFALYPLLLWKVKPKTIIEIGSKDGGSALWFGDMLNNFGIDGHVYSVDIVGVKSVSHPRVTFLEGNGRQLESTFSPEFLRSLPRPLLVIEDADHSYETSSAVLNFFDRHLAADEYIVIEDGIISDLSKDSHCNSGPHRALKEFLGARPGEYSADQSLADFFGYNYTWCTNGFLKKKKYPINSAVPKDVVRKFNEQDPAPQGHESQMSTNERFQLFYVLEKLMQGVEGNIRFVEIGSHAGASLKLTYRTLASRFSLVQGFAVEPAGTSQFYEVIEEFKNNIAHLKSFSHPAAPVLADFFQQDGLFAEFIFVDGDHTYEGVKQDIIDYYPLLRPGGVMLFHDYLPALNAENRDAIFFHHGGKEPGIRQACEELMERQYGCQPIELPLLYPTDPTQTQPHLPVIPGVYSTVRAYRKP